jgi:hypothetical protein
MPDAGGSRGREFEDRCTNFILQLQRKAYLEPQIALQNVSVPTPTVSFFALSVFDSREPSVEPCQPLDYFGITYVIKAN